MPRALVCCLLVLVSTAAPRGQAGPAVRPERETRPGALSIYIARHGETVGNAERRVIGQLDSPLNERGRVQAEELKDVVRGIHFDAIYASPLSRSLTTASIVADGRPVRVLMGLRERNQGRFQGLLADSLADFTPRMGNPRDDLDGGETTLQLAARVRQAVATIRRLHRTGSVLVVGHFLTNQMILSDLLALPVEQAMRINQANDELYLVELHPPRRAVVWKLIGRNRLGEL